jgi:hypothetical protein
MANDEQVEVLKRGADDWNAWRKRNPRVTPDLSGANLINVDLSRADLSGADLRQADLSKAQLSHATLHGANLESATLILADLLGAILNEANLSGTSFFGAFLFATHLKGARLVGANMLGATLMGADLSGADLEGAHLMGANFHEANLSSANLTRADLTSASLVRTNIEGALFSDCQVHGVSAWDLEGEPALQERLTVSARGESSITVDELETGQFLNLLLHGKRIAGFLEDGSLKMALIQGRFRSGQEELLQALKRVLHERGYMPVVAETERPASPETPSSIVALGRAARLLILDLTGLGKLGRSALEHFLSKAGQTPVQLLVDVSRADVSMLEGLPHADSLLEPIKYKSTEQAVGSIESQALPAAERKSRLLR